MKIKDTIFRRKAGKSKGKWIVRISYLGESIERTFATQVGAKQFRNWKLEELEKNNGQSLKAEKITFNKLADECEEKLYHAAVIENGYKSSGVKSHASNKSHIKALREYFGKYPVAEITDKTVRAYRANRKSKYGVKPATINRDLEILRHMMREVLPDNFVKAIFKGMILKKAEEARTRLLSEAEESNLLAACSGERSTTYTRKRFGKKETIQATLKVSPYLKGMVMLAIDSAMRRGEILKLRWADIDFDKNQINVLGTNTKTEESRKVPLTERVKKELAALIEVNEGVPFPITDFKNSWKAAKKSAGIEDLRFHDLRSTAISRWLNKHRLPLSVVSKTAGHSNIETTNRYYTIADDEDLANFADAMNSRHAPAEVLDAEILV
jgi:integrase